jgi:2-methylisocitrate lyase-like PEP mutase family enzyme
MAQVKAETNGHAAMSAASRLRGLLSRENHITVCPGVYDGLTARLAQQDDFDCLYMVRLKFSRHTTIGDFPNADEEIDWRRHSSLTAWHA